MLSMHQSPATIELLAPAKDAATAIAAIDHGADAVYMGASAFGARSQAGNGMAEIAQVARYAHRFGVKLYITVNTIVYDNELEQIRKLIWDIWREGADAIIVQDLAITRMALPPIALHASTQCDTRTPEKAVFLEKCGFTRIVLARELTLDEIAGIRRQVHADLEVFVHGALCVSYSGDCQASYMLTGRSANRGECCQVCRFKFDLEDGQGNKIIKGKHLLSLRDMNRIENLEALLEAGASSLKIEGRLKDAAYVKNVVGAYRKKLDSIIAAHPDRYRRASHGRPVLSFNPDPSLSFNRGFTDYFLKSPNPSAASMATFNSPKWTGKPVGKVLRQGKEAITAALECRLNNGDGLGYYDSSGEFKGFRLNRIDGDRLFPAGNVRIAPGTLIYRNADKERTDMLSRETAIRKIDVSMTLEWRNHILVLVMRDECGYEITVAEESERQIARTPQTDRRRKELEKLGDTIFNSLGVQDLCGDTFIPASILAKLRRRGVEMLESARAAAYRAEKPGTPSSGISLPHGYEVTRHDNIANEVSARFYSALSAAGTRNLPRAIEVSHGKTVSDNMEGEGIRVMETRYCLRREMGKCLKTSAGKELPSKLFLTSEGNRFRLEFDCRNCRMQVWLLKT